MKQIEKTNTPRKRLTLKLLLVLLSGIIPLLLAGCNYNYHQGLQLEEEGRYEEANIEYHLAYTSSPGNDTYKEAFERTAKMTADDLMVRYRRYVGEKRYFMAYHRLEQARALAPEMPEIADEQKKWYKVLLAGRVDLVGLKSLRNQLPLSEKIKFTVKINTPNEKRTLEAPVDYRNRTFSVEDILYDPPQDLLLLYSLNSIGVKLTSYRTNDSRYQKFIDFRTPAPSLIQGKLTRLTGDLRPVIEAYPVDVLNKAVKTSYWEPPRGIRYTLRMNDQTIQVETGDGRIEYLPQMLYLNSQDRRFFVDFGHYEISQPEFNSREWAIRRVVSEDRQYLKDLKKNLLLNVYFSYREGAYPFEVIK